MYSIKKSKDLILDIIKTDSFHLKSAQDNVVKMLEHVTVLPLLKLHIQFFFQRAGVFLMEFM